MNNFWVYFFSSLLSLIGSNLFMFTQGWYLLQLTGEKTSVGTTWTIFFIPGLILLPIIGRILDRPDLKTILAKIEFAKVVLFTTFMILIGHYPSKYLVYLLAVLYGMAFAPYFPSTYVLIKRLVESSKQARYSHLFEISLQLSNIIAVFASGFLFEALGFHNLLGLSAAFIALGAVGILTLKLDLPNSTVHSKSFVSAYTDLLNLLVEIRRDKVLTSKQFLFGSIHQFPHALIMVSNVPLILYVYEIMRKTPREFGMIDSSIGAMGVIAGLFWARFHKYSERKSVFIFTSIFAGVATLSLGLMSHSKILPYFGIALMGGLLISSKIIARAAVVYMLPKNRVGLYSSIFQTLGSMIMLSLFVITSLLSRVLTADLLFVMLGGLMLLYSAGLTLLYTPPKHLAQKL